MLDETLRGTKAIVVETEDLNCSIFHLLRIDSKYYLVFENDSKLIYHLRLKPNFLVYYLQGDYQEAIEIIKPLFSNFKRVKVTQCYIDPSIFDVLVNEKLISYSKATSSLFNLPINKSLNNFYYYNKCKRKCNKNKILALRKL